MCSIPIKLEVTLLNMFPLNTVQVDTPGRVEGPLTFNRQT